MKKWPNVVVMIFPCYCMWCSMVQEGPGLGSNKPLLIHNNNNSVLRTLTEISAITSLCSELRVYCHPGLKLVPQRDPGKHRTMLIVHLERALENGLRKLFRVSSCYGGHTKRKLRSFATNKLFLPRVFSGLNQTFVIETSFNFLSDETLIVTSVIWGL